MLRRIPSSNWNYSTAAHLLNRAGFGGSPAEIAALAARAPEEAVDQLLQFETIHEKFDPPSWVEPAEALRPDRPLTQAVTAEERQQLLRQRRMEEHQKLAELRAWWLYRMRYSPRPLQEKLTLFWHGHFATSVQKVHAAYMMYLQNETFRARAAGNWRDFIVAVARDPAMLMYLDNALSRPDAPNENFARELMELFTLGEGRYTEQDIKESARAFTGWTVQRDRYAFVERRRLHDDGTKRFMNRSGRFHGTDIIEIILQQPAAADFIAHKVWTFFAFADPPPALVATLAATLRDSRYELKPLLRELFLSEVFYSPAARRSQIKSPVDWLVGSVKALEGPMPGADACQYALRALGQELFMPPNVKGWDGGTSWITTATLLHRYNFAGALVKGSEGMAAEPDGQGLAFAVRRRQMYGDLPEMNDRPAGRFRGGLFVESIVDVEKILPASARADRAAALASLEARLFGGGALPEKEREVVTAFVEALPPPARWTDTHVKDILHLLMSTPAYQLC